MPSVKMELEEDIVEVLISEEALAQRVAELGAEISKDYAGKELMLICILKGANMFLADLARQISVPVSYDFVAVSSYGADTKSSGVVRILKDLDESVESKHVLVIEDIVDTGLTLRLSYLLENLRSRRAASVKVCTLLDKAVTSSDGCSRGLFRFQGRKSICRGLWSGLSGALSYFALYWTFEARNLWGWVISRRSYKTNCVES